MNNEFARVSVLIPAYNEQDIIASTLTGLEEVGVGEVIVINDGSDDGTGDILKDYRVQCIDLAFNRGKGEAVAIGLREACKDIIAVLDADLGVTVREVEKLLRPVIRGETDITIGVMSCSGGGLGLVRLLAGRGLKYLTGKTLAAPLSGQRVFRREALEALQPFAPGFGLETGLNIEILMQGISFQEINVNFKHRVSGHTWSGYRHRWEQFRAVFRTLWQKRGYR